MLGSRCLNSVLKSPSPAPLNFVSYFLFPVLELNSQSDSLPLSSKDSQQQLQDKEHPPSSYFQEKKKILPLTLNESCSHLRGNHWWPCFTRSGHVPICCAGESPVGQTDLKGETDWEGKRERQIQNLSNSPRKEVDSVYRRDFRRLKIADGHQLHNTVSGSAKAVTGRGGKWVDL